MSWLELFFDLVFVVVISRLAHHLAGHLDVTGVITDCGIRFAPQPVAFGRTALPGEPLDPEQICPQCYRARDAR